MRESSSFDHRQHRPSGKVWRRRSPGRAPLAVGPATNAGPHGPLNDGHGPVLSTARVRLVYWGADWAANAPLKSAIDAAAGSILTSAYVQGLSEYRPTIGSGSLEDSQLYTAGSGPTNNFTDDDVKSLLGDMISQSLLPEPLDDQHLYVTITPPGIQVNGTLGEHWYFDYPCRDGVTRRVHYGWVTGTSINDYSCTLSHELVESITDPEMDAITFLGCPGVVGTCEIGDVCNTCYRLDDGTVVQDWYSAAADGCVRPH